MILSIVNPLNFFLLDLRLSSFSELSQRSREDLLSLLLQAN